MLEAGEIKKLLESYQMLEAYLKNLNKAIEYEEKKPSSDIIGAMSLTQSISAMPFPPVGTVSNKTADIALSYSGQAQKEIEAMRQESRLICNVLSQLNCAVNSLEEPYKDIIIKYFFEKAKYKDLVNAFGTATQQRSERTIGRIIRRTLCKIAKLVNISKSDYYYIASQERLHA